MVAKDLDTNKNKKTKTNKKTNTKMTTDVNVNMDFYQFLPPSKIERSLKLNINSKQEFHLNELNTLIQKMIPMSEEGKKIKIEEINLFDVKLETTMTTEFIDFCKFVNELEDLPKLYKADLNKVTNVKVLKKLLSFTKIRISHNTSSIISNVVNQLINVWLENVMNYCYVNNLTTLKLKHLMMYDCNDNKIKITWN